MCVILLFIFQILRTAHIKAESKERKKTSEITSGMCDTNIYHYKTYLHKNKNKMECIVKLQCFLHNAKYRIQNKEEEEKKTDIFINV